MTRQVRHTAVAATTLLALLGAAPALAAAAPSIKADLPCYTPEQPITLGGAGFTPTADVVFLLALSGRNGHQVLYTDPVKTDATGALSARLRAPALAADTDARETVDLTANDQSRGGPDGPALEPPEDSVAATQFRLSSFDASVDAWQAGRVDPRRSGRLRVTGWEPYHVVWAHYYFNTRRVRSIRIGTVSGPCGDLTKTIRQFPFPNVKAGSWTVYFSPTRVFDRHGMWLEGRREAPALARLGRLSAGFLPPPLRIG
jgi:hypothetical protein